MRFDHQILLKLPPTLTLLAGSAHSKDIVLFRSPAGCNMNPKGQKWNEYILTVTRLIEKSPSYQLIEVGPWVVSQIHKGSKLLFSDVNRNRRLGLIPRRPCSGVATGLLKTSRTQLKTGRNDTALKPVSNTFKITNFSSS